QAAEPTSTTRERGANGSGNANANGSGNGNGHAPSGNPAPRASSGAPPRSGKALFAWTKDQEQRHEVGLLKYLNSWAKLQDFPGRMVEWDADQVSQAYAEAIRKLQSISTGHAEAREEALAN